MSKSNHHQDDMYEYENKLYEGGKNYIAGVDEVGRGPLIGPVVTACVILPKNFELKGLNDSKQLTEKQRNNYYEYIINHCIDYQIGMCSPEEIDNLNIYQASKLAMLKAINKLKVIPDHILVDAMPLPLENTTSIIKGDSKSITIAAASVIAKVTRDKMMDELHEKYPHYDFKSHKGYPTKKHLEAIKKHGLIEGYRKSYAPVKQILFNPQKLISNNIIIYNYKKNNLIYQKDQADIFTVPTQILLHQIIIENINLKNLTKIEINLLKNTICTNKIPSKQIQDKIINIDRLLNEKIKQYTTNNNQITLENILMIIINTLKNLTYKKTLSNKKNTTKIISQMCQIQNQNPEDFQIIKAIINHENISISITTNLIVITNKSTHLIDLKSICQNLN